MIETCAAVFALLVAKEIRMSRTALLKFLQDLTQQLGSQLPPCCSPSIDKLSGARRVRDRQ